MAAATFHWDDPLLLDLQLSDDERIVRDAANAYAQGKLAPRVTEAFRHETTDAAIFREMGEVGLLGPTIPEAYGGPGLSYVSYGLIAREVERVDSGYRSMMSVQSSLVMVPIFEFGSDAQKEKYLPKLATGEWIGCFGLTEPNHGSDPGSMVTRAKKVPGGYALSGSKMWITNSPIADVHVAVEPREKVHPEHVAAALGHAQAADGLAVERQPAHEVIARLADAVGRHARPRAAERRRGLAARKVRERRRRRDRIARAGIEAEHRPLIAKIDAHGGRLAEAVLVRHAMREALPGGRMAPDRQRAAAIVGDPAQLAKDLDADDAVDLRAQHLRQQR